MIRHRLGTPLTTTLVRVLVLVAVVVAFTAPDAWAIPSFARKYQTSCATCHAAYPKLNAFGKAFKNNGYRYPDGTDAEVTKEKPVSLGAEGYKRMWPDALWPADIAGTIPVGIRAILRANAYESDASNNSFEFPHEFEMFAAGTIGETFSYFGEVEIENEDNENEIATPFFLQYDPRPGLHIRIGEVTPHPFSDGLRLTSSHYNPYDVRTTASSITLKATNPNNPSGPQLSFTGRNDEDRWRFRNGQPGVEVWGARNGPGGNGGLTWAAGIVNGQGQVDANGDKDIFARVGYKFGGYGELGGGESLDHGEHEHNRDDSIKVGLFTYRGTSTNTYSGSMVALDPTKPAGITTVSASKEIQNDFDLVGVDFDWWFRDLNLYGLYARQSDDDPRGTGETIDTDTWSVEGDWTIYPWLIGVLRYGQNKQDFSIRADPATQQFLVPAVVFLARANVKFTAEAQMRLDDAGKGNDAFVLAVDFAF